MHGARKAAGAPLNRHADRHAEVWLAFNNLRHDGRINRAGPCRRITRHWCRHALQRRLPWTRRRCRVRIEHRQQRLLANPRRRATRDFGSGRFARLEECRLFLQKLGKLSVVSHLTNRSSPWCLLRSNRSPARRELGKRADCRRAAARAALASLSRRVCATVQCGPRASAHHALGANTQPVWTSGPWQRVFLNAISTRAAELSRTPRGNDAATHVMAITKTTPKGSRDQACPGRGRRGSERRERCVHLERTLATPRTRTAAHRPLAGYQAGLSSYERPSPSHVQRVGSSQNSGLVPSTEHMFL